MNQMHVRFGPEDDDLWGALKSLPPGARSRAVREALRLVLLGPPVMRNLAEAFGRLPAPEAWTAPVPSAETPPMDGPPARQITETELDDFLSVFKG